ncbi:hypothetical protein ACHAXA_007914 [Cyclostephanos tholiformis]|uniref:Uncharacterized protein n=1 Tax=Cyclostephanos tholiformis TaxID=382380 RepID=A0ABD3SHH4_9STRA
MTEEMRGSIINIAQRAFHAPVNGGGKVYQTIADLIRVEIQNGYDDVAGGGGRDGSRGGDGNDEPPPGVSTGGWNCVVGDAFGSSVTHRMKTYIHFSIVPRVNVLLWRS